MNGSTNLTPPPLEASPKRAVEIVEKFQLLPGEIVENFLANQKSAVDLPFLTVIMNLTTPVEGSLKMILIYIFEKVEILPSPL